MAVENWIDAVAKAFEIDDGRGGTVRSYRVFEKAEFPEALSDYPCAITYPVSVSSQYSLGGPCIDLWRGKTEFHITENVNKGNLPMLLRYIARIRYAAAANMKLGGLVEHFVLSTEGPSILGPVVLRYGGEEPHQGFIVHWVVKENVSGDFTVATGE